MSITFNHLGNRYKSLNITLPPNTSDYSLMENNSDTFPDWNENWDERDYWNICVIKNLVSDGHGAELGVKFHDITYNDIPITKDDVPAIFEPFVFRDIYLSNPDTIYEISFDITVFNNRTITPPPYKPENLKVIDSTTSYITLQFEDISLKNDNFDEKYFRVERSITSSSEGFTQIDTIKGTSLRFQNQLETLQYTDEGVSTGNTYWYRVRAYNEEGGNSPYSNVVEITV